MLDRLKQALAISAESLIRRACEKISPRFSPSKTRTIYDRNGISPYLTRFYLLGHRHEDRENEDEGSSVMPRLANLYLHHFHRGDDDGALHSHPWKWSVALILVGGYWEERRVGDGVIRRLVRPLSLNTIMEEDYHRVDLIEKDAWTLFLAGPRVGTWYFWVRGMNLRARWDLYIKWLRDGIASDDNGETIWERDSREAVSYLTLYDESQSEKKA